MHNLKNFFFSNLAIYKNSLISGLSCDENNDYIPWFSLNAVQFIKNNFNKNWKILEYGSGASTLFFLKNNVSHLISIESNQFWYDFLANKIATIYSSKQKSDHVFIMVNNAINDESYEKLAKNLSKNYGKFDVVIIDSLKRYKCAINSILAIKDDGIIILDDSERDNYNKIFSFLKERGFASIDFPGYAAGGFRIKNTTIFTKNSVLINKAINNNA